MYLARIFVTLKPAVNDPQGETVLSSLKQLGFVSVDDVRIGKYLEVQLDAVDQTLAERQVVDMCQKLLANPVIEQYSFDLEDIAAAHESPNPS